MLSLRLARASMPAEDACYLWASSRQDLESGRRTFTLLAPQHAWSEPNDFFAFETCEFRNFRISKPNFQISKLRLAKCCNAHQKHNSNVFLFVHEQRGLLDYHRRD